MNEYIEEFDFDKSVEEKGMIKNRDIVIINENKLVSCRNLFNIFWKTNKNIIYITGNRESLIGVITDKSLLNQMKKNKYEKPEINRECSIIKYEEDRYLFKIAKKLFDKYHITTAIPVIDEEGKICFEIRKRDLEDEKKTILEFQKKIEKYKKSYYLKNEVKCLRRLLEEQDIVVIGEKRRFHDMFGNLILNESRITYVKELKDAYDFMYKNKLLFIDLSQIGCRGRKDIYSICNNGYYWSQFMAFVIAMIEAEYCSKIYQILDNNKEVSLRDFLVKYKVGTIIFSKRSIFTSAFLTYTKEHKFNVVEQEGVFRTESFSYDIIENGIKINKKWGSDELITIECVDLISQLLYLNQKLSDKVQILNFIFDEEVEITESEYKRISSEILDDELYLSLYSMGEDTRIEYLRELDSFLQFNHTRSFENDLVVFDDINTELVNVENGLRRTCYQPEEYTKTIYFIGGCTIWGRLVEDRYTIPSLIQKYINQLDEGKGYRVINLGNGNLLNAVNLLESINIEENDIIVTLFPFVTNYVKEVITTIEISKSFNEIRRGKYDGEECFLDMVQHCGTNGMIIYSEIIFKELKKYLLPSTERQRKNTIYNVFRKNYKDLNVLYDYESYIKELEYKQKGILDKNKQIGCIIMNCNPFTYGHRYLVEYAAAKVDYVYLFVLEEDKSYFTFDDRYGMVKEGISDLKNVILVRSGKMIISSLTFPAYFTKQEVTYGKREPSVDLDLKIFAQYIVPIFNIQFRFVGEEPTDFVTAIYNDRMKKILPEFGIQVIEIPRKCIDENVISASRVREYYKENNFTELSKLVPSTTMKYLLTKINAQ